MRLKKDSSEQKLRGAYYTPLQLANAMVSLVASDNIESVLEPSCGDGVFLDSLAALGKINDIPNTTAVEIESDEAEKVRNNFKDNKNVSVLNEDFLDFYQRVYGKETYDLILGNPPYIRYQYLTEEQREIQSNILTSHGMKSNKLINAWVAFLVACVQLLSDNGKIAFVIPAEILQVVYAEDLRLFLSNQLSKITLLTFEQLVFPDIEQEILVFIGEKGKEEKGIRIIELNNLEDFEKLDLNSNGFQKLKHVKEKWTKYFVSAEEIKIIQSIREDKRFTKFSDLALINVGITTGNNTYFSVDKETTEKYELSSVTLPLIGRSSHAHGIYFTDNDWKENIESDKKAMLISFPDTPYEEYPDKHKDYIKFGEDNEQNKGYKCSIRDRWYIVPSVWIPDAFFLRRNNLYPKFVLNRCNAVSTDTMHRIKFNDGVNAENILLSYYNSISFAFTEICGRSYGGGVLEILPGEVGDIMLPVINNIDSKIKTKLLKQINTIVSKNDDIEKALDIVDQKVLIELLGIDKEICSSCRNIWRKMQKRRLGRG
ncbi:MAG: N-6 DNA methylase [Ruminococcus sp.]|nr:N-6 DNA methylase [Ruminococcus sp.]